MKLSPIQRSLVFAVFAGVVGFVAGSTSYERHPEWGEAADRLQRLMKALLAGVFGTISGFIAGLVVIAIRHLWPPGDDST